MSLISGISQALILPFAKALLDTAIKKPNAAFKGFREISSKNVFRQTFFHHNETRSSYQNTGKVIIKRIEAQALNKSFVRIQVPESSKCPHRQHPNHIAGIFSSLLYENRPISKYLNV